MDKAFKFLFALQQMRHHLRDWRFESSQGRLIIWQVILLLILDLLLLVLLLLLMLLFLLLLLLLLLLRFIYDFLEYLHQLSISTGIAKI